MAQTCETRGENENGERESGTYTWKWMEVIFCHFLYPVKERKSCHTPIPIIKCLPTVISHLYWKEKVVALKVLDGIEPRDLRYMIASHNTRKTTPEKRLGFNIQHWFALIIIIIFLKYSFKIRPNFWPLMSNVMWETVDVKTPSLQVLQSSLASRH